jgi:hypothetical protein
VSCYDLSFIFFSSWWMRHIQVFSLWCISPRSNGGLSFTTVDVGNVLSISGTLNPKTPHPKPYVRLTPTSCNELSVHQHPIHHAFTGLHWGFRLHVFPVYHCGLLFHSSSLPLNSRLSSLSKCFDISVITLWGIWICLGFLFSLVWVAPSNTLGLLFCVWW